jgi:hypothetical protein
LPELPLASTQNLSMSGLTIRIAREQPEQNGVFLFLRELAISYWLLG